MGLKTTACRLYFAALLAVFLGGCHGPLGFLPGKALAGSEAEFTAANVPAQGGVIQLETNPDEPYSVNVGFIVIDGQLYIDPAPGRVWYQNMQKNSDVRLRFDGDAVVYRASVFPVVDQALIDRFEKDRIPMRIGPRS